MKGDAPFAVSETPKKKDISFQFPYKVLLVEDNPVNQEVAREMLEFLGCNLEIAFNGKESIDMFALKNYDLILMDCQMPEMDGYEATSHIRKMELFRNYQNHRTPIIALTAHAMKGDRDVCIKSGMDDYLSKPFNLGELQSILKRWSPESLQTKTANL